MLFRSEAFLTAGEDIFINKRFYNPALRKSGEKLFEDYSLQDNQVNMVCFYRIVCPDCKQIAPIIDNLPASVMVNGKSLPLNLIRINTRSGNNNERIAAFFEKYQVPDRDRQVPIIFFADSYLSGTESIRAGLYEELTNPVYENKLGELIQ